MNLPGRDRILALPGGDAIWRALDALATAMPESGSGSWTATDVSGANLKLIPRFAGSWIRHGRLVMAPVGVIYPTNSSTAIAKIGGLPVRCDTRNNHGALVYVTTAGISFTGTVLAGTTTVQLFKNTAVGVTNAELSGKHVGLTAVYFTA